MTHEPHHHDHQHSSAADKERDPVCGMLVDPATAVSTEHDGRTYYFCCDGCRNSFIAHPDKYLNAKPFELPTSKPAARAPRHHEAARQTHAAPGERGTKYTCPMHPQIVQDGPGDCPICGMALEPMVASLDDTPYPELADFTRRLVVSASPAGPFGLCSTSHRKPHDASAMVAMKMYRSNKSWRETCCGCDPARRCPSMAI